MRNTKDKCIFHYRFSPESFEYTLVFLNITFCSNSMYLHHCSYLRYEAFTAAEIISDDQGYWRQTVSETSEFIFILIRLIDLEVIISDYLQTELLQSKYFIVCLCHKLVVSKVLLTNYIFIIYYSYREIVNRNAKNDTVYAYAYTCEDTYTHMQLDINTGFGMPSKSVVYFNMTSRA